MTTSKEAFLKNNFIPLLRRLQDDEKPQWGTMKAQQMIEHFADAVQNASGKLILPLLNEGERLQKTRDFLMTEEPFKENINNPLISREGIQLRQKDISSAIDKLQKELDYFFKVFDKNPDLKTQQCFFWRA